MKSSSTRDSGVPWIGQIRVDWPILPAKAVFKQRSTASRPDDLHLTPSQQHGVMPQAEYMALTGNQVVLNLTGADNMRHVEPGDYISHLRSFQGGLEYSAYAGKVSAAYTVLTPRKKVDPHYYRFLFKSMQYVQGLQTTTDQMRDGQSIRYGQFALLPLPYPPLEEQRRIAEFLDRETAQIDELIAKQEQLISTLAERRDRYLLREVAPLAGDATGTEWFGKVPKGWRSTRLKYVSSVASGGTPSTQVEAYWSETEEGTPWVAISDMSGTDAVGSTAKRLTIDGLSQYAGAPGRPGTILFAMYASVGAVSRLAVSATWNQAILGLTPRKDVDGDFLFYVLKAIRPHLVHYFRSNTQDNMNAQQVAGLPLLMPPLDEQRRISARVKSQLDDYRAVSERANAVIATLRERRQALISAAVTGQIDVGGAS